MKRCVYIHTYIYIYIPIYVNIYKCVGFRRNSFLNESSSPVRKDLKHERKRGGFRLFTSSGDGNLHTPTRSAAAMGDLGTPVKMVRMY
jgi:hypothetical protein